MFYVFVFCVGVCVCAVEHKKHGTPVQLQVGLLGNNQYKIKYNAYIMKGENSPPPRGLGLPAEWPPPPPWGPGGGRLHTFGPPLPLWGPGDGGVGGEGMGRARGKG